MLMPVLAATKRDKYYVADRNGGLSL